MSEKKIVLTAYKYNQDNIGKVKEVPLIIVKR